MSDYFGKGCKYFIGKWEDEDIYDADTYKEFEPVLVYCNHPENKESVEGNCNPDQCPILLKNILIEDEQRFELGRQVFIKDLGSIGMKEMEGLFESHINFRHKLQSLASIVQNPVYLTKEDLNNYLKDFNLFVIELRDLKIKTAKFVKENMIKK